MPIKDMTGQRFGRLTVLNRSKSDGNGNARWNYRCDCGKIGTTLGFNLRCGASQSCGCWEKETKSERFTKHGHAKKRSSTYVSWASMIQRCTNPKSRKFNIYGGRGITVCDRWFSFENFLSDMGEKPSGKRISIDRFPDRQGNYEPDNCRWATPSQQNSNKSNQHWVTYKGKTMTLSEASAIIGINRGTVFSRLNLGWPINRALLTPIKRQLWRQKPVSSGRRF